ncbi:MAG: tetratricopeptide repeat protein [Rubripirellula sp.]|nr:tetratricopeptide repeat protein [Rubripirellula sp.]
MIAGSNSSSTLHLASLPYLASLPFLACLLFGMQTTSGHAQDEVASQTEKTEGTNAGQNDLDEAIVQRIDAQSDEQLGAVSALLESAIKKGLDDENRSFAKKMLASVQLQRSQAMAGAMLRVPGRRQLQLRDEALESLSTAIEHDPSLIEAYFLIARLNMLPLPGGDPKAVLEATTKVIELLEDDPAQKSEALWMRARVQTEQESKLADLNAALEADPTNLRAIQERAGIRLENGDVENALKDLEAVLLEDPTNQQIAGAAVEELVNLNRLDEAIELVTKLLAKSPSEGMYRMRAILHRSKGNLDEALSDLNKAIAMAPKDPMTLLQRAEVALDRDDIKSAKEDFRNATQVAPQILNLEMVIGLRSRIALLENRLADAINDAQLLADRNPNNTFHRLRLASLYTMDNRPRKAIEVLSELLQGDPGNVPALRSRGDAQLSVGDHKKAIEDYEAAVDSVGEIEFETADEFQKQEAAGIYNNLSWVLATSPNDSVRDGKRSLELAEKAAKLSDYKAAHILSTLAAAYAEAGNFEKAIQWSEKAVQLGDEEDHEQLEQLELELDSYRKGEAWREKQDTEENQVPILSPEDLIDT